MTILFSNYASTTLLANITAGQTTFVVASVVSMPAVTTASGNYFYLTLIDAASVNGAVNPPNQREVVKVTDITGNTLTVTRGQDGTTAQAFMLGAYAELRFNAQAARDLRDSRVNVKTAFGVVADGVTNDTANMNLAIAYANANPGTVLWCPQGSYTFPTGLNPITSSGIWIEGDAPEATTFKCADNSVVVFGAAGFPVDGGGIRSLTFSYAATPGATACCVQFVNAARIRVQDIRVLNAGIIASLGVAGSTAASQIHFHTINGYVANTAQPAFQLIYGAGFIGNDIDIYVAVANTVFPVSHGVDIARIAFDVVGPWDTIVLSDIVVQQFYTGLRLILTVVGNIYGVWLNNFICDSNDGPGLYVAPTVNGSIGGLTFNNCHWNSWREDGIRFDSSGGGTCQMVNFSNCEVFYTYKHGLIVNTVDLKNWTWTGGAIFGNNGAAGAYDAINLIAGATRFNITGARIAYSTTIALGTNYQGTYGINMGAAPDFCVISGNSINGATAPINASTYGTVVRIENNITVGSQVIASAATITLPPNDEGYHSISGATNITSITASWAGRTVTLIFQGALTFTDGSNLKLAGNLVTTADDSISLVCDGTNWFEQSRSIN
jgi:hypothetical protein